MSEAASPGIIIRYRYSDQSVDLPTPPNILQSHFYVKVYQEQLVDAHNVITLDFHHSTVQAMLTFMEHGGYDYTPIVLQSSQTSRPESEMRLHLSVYQLGAYADDIAMMEAAENHFGLVIKDHWTDPYFLTVIHQAYQNAPPGPPGATLRGIVLTMVANHIVTLCRNPQFIALSEGIPLFGGEVTQVLAGVHDVQPAEKIAYKCGDDECNTLHVVNLDGQVLTRCHYLQHDDGMEPLGLLRLFKGPFIGCAWSFFSTKAIDKPNDSDEENDDLDEGPILCLACGHSSDNRDWSLNTDFRARRGYAEGW